MRSRLRQELGAWLSLQTCSTGHIGGEQSHEVSGAPGHRLPGRCAQERYGVMARNRGRRQSRGSFWPWAMVEILTKDVKVGSRP